MPAARLTGQASIVHPYDVLAQSDGGDLMLHALLCNEADVRDDVTSETVLRTFHMGPPLGPRRMPCDAFGTAELTTGQAAKLKAFLADRQEERNAEERRLRRLGRRWRAGSQYRIHPEATPPTPDYPLWRFSCVGFVLRAYQSARVHLLTGPYPSKTMEDLKRLYPHSAGHLDDPGQRNALGIGDGDRWPVILVGYVLHSLNRAASDINGANAQRYAPQIGDEYFPRAVVAERPLGNAGRSKSRGSPTEQG
jgi:hypothetical protein